jgi:hypothetical protein
LDLAAVTGGWRKLHNEEFYNSYSSPNIIRMIKSRRTRLAGHWREIYTSFGRAGNIKERDHLEDLGVDGRIILKLRNIVGGFGPYLLGSG